MPTKKVKAKARNIRVVCYVTNRTGTWLARQAKRQGCSISQLVRYLLDARMPEPRTGEHGYMAGYSQGFDEGYQDGLGTGKEEKPK